MRDRAHELRVTVPGLSANEIATIKAIKKAGKYKNYSGFIQHLVDKYDAPSR